MFAVVRQRHRGDCGLASLATLLVGSLAYEHVHAAAGLIEPKWHGTRGLRVGDLRRVAATLGVEFDVRRRLELDTAVGILVAHGPHVAREGHYVAVAHGVVLDPADGVARTWRDYQAHYGARFTTLLALRGGLARRRLPAARPVPHAAPRRTAA